MKRTLFLILWTIPLLGGPAQGSIEIYANGHHYDSLQAYQASKKSAMLGSRVDAKVMPDITRHQLYVLSIENGVVNALQGFYGSQGGQQLIFQIPHEISDAQLQEAIQQAVTSSTDPKLLIAQPGKMRIMALTTKDSTP